MTNLIQIRYLRVGLLQPFLFILDLPLILRVVHNKNQETTWVKTWNFTNVINCFCCYVINLAGETAKNVLLPIIWNLLLIEISLSEIRISYSKREKVCAVCPYLSFKYVYKVEGKYCKCHYCNWWLFML